MMLDWCIVKQHIETDLYSLVKAGTFVCKVNQVFK
jgi:hypothetical protein